MRSLIAKLLSPIGAPTRELSEARQAEAVGHLAGDIVHEFNNLLQTIEACTRCAMDEDSPPKRRMEDLDQVLTASKRAAALTRRLLTFGRHEETERRNVPLNSLVLDFQRMLRPLIGDRLDIALDLTEEDDTVCANEGQLHQVLLNLCLNARDAVASCGQLTIASRVVDLDGAALASLRDVSPTRYVLLSVTDTGCGMSPETQQHVFKPFFTTKEGGKGSGLGLAIVQRIVRGHEGMIRVDSREGRGTTFEVYLPAVGATKGSKPNGTVGCRETIDPCIANDLSPKPRGCTPWV